jgi:hypothetical protein
MERRKWRWEMREETKFYGETEQEVEMPVSNPESPTSFAVAAKEIRQILKDNREAKKALAMVLEAHGLSREAAFRLLHLESE